VSAISARVAASTHSGTKTGRAPRVEVVPGGLLWLGRFGRQGGGHGPGSPGGYGELKRWLLGLVLQLEQRVLRATMI